MDVLKNKSYKEYNRLSRYSSTPYYYHTLDNKYFYGVDSYLKNTTSSINHTVVKGDTYDTLAQYYYHNPTYFWIICSFNHIQDPYEVPIPGTVLKIPTISGLEFDTE